MNYFKLCLSALIMAAMISSCDIIEPPYTTGGNNNDTGSVEVKQKVYVEYFTGHRCPNCPAEAFQLKQLQQQFGDRLIFISVHSGFFAEPLASGNYTSDYRTTTGNQLDQAFSVTSISTPNALVNRTSFDGNVVLPPASWAGAIAEQLLKLPAAAIYLEPTFQGNNIQLNAGIKPLAQIDGTFMISAYIVEDSIISYQKNNNASIGVTPDIPDYAHRYVLRGSLNGTFGDTLFSPTANLTDSFTVQLTAAKDPIWNNAKLYVVCFVYNKETDEVLQVEMKKIQ